MANAGARGDRALALWHHGGAKKLLLAASYSGNHNWATATTFKLEIGKTYEMEWQVDNVWKYS